MKIVINKCYGGFGLSVQAVIDYAKRKGVDNPTFRAGLPEKNLTADEALKSSETFLFCNEFYDRDIERTDADLVAVVEALGDKASGRFAQLEVIEIPDGIEWEIEEYDGIEWVSEAHRRWE